VNYDLLRRLLFAFPPEQSHAATLSAFRLLGAAPASRRSMPPVQFEACRLSFPNRVGLAAGFDKNAMAIDGLGRLGFGFLEIGTVTPRPQAGNPTPRIFRLTESRALINRMGFPNDGAHEVAARLRRRRFSGVVGVNIGKNASTSLSEAVDDYRHGFEVLGPFADYIAVNVSSPNTIGLRELQDSERLRPILEGLAEARRRLEMQSGRHVPLLLKIAPELDPAAVAAIASLVDSFGIEGVIATNTTVERTSVARDPLAAQSGGLSGAPLLPASLAMVRRVRSALPRSLIIGCGGIDSARAAQEMCRAGADLVQLYTGLVYRGPGVIREIATALAVDDVNRLGYPP